MGNHSKRVPFCEVFAQNDTSLKFGGGIEGMPAKENDGA
jgi:hypothetical protein